MAEMAISPQEWLDFSDLIQSCFCFTLDFWTNFTSRTKHIRNAVEILREKVDFEFDGDMQPDVALTRIRRALSFAKIVGKANILIMPGQHSAVISYKLMKTIEKQKL